MSRWTDWADPWGGGHLIEGPGHLEDALAAHSNRPVGGACLAVAAVAAAAVAAVVVDALLALEEGSQHSGRTDFDDLPQAAVAEREGGFAYLALVGGGCLPGAAQAREAVARLLGGTWGMLCATRATDVDSAHGSNGHMEAF